MYIDRDGEGEGRAMTTVMMQLLVVNSRPFVLRVGPAWGHACFVQLNVALTRPLLLRKRFGLQLVELTNPPTYCCDRTLFHSLIHS